MGGYLLCTSIQPGSPSFHGELPEACVLCCNRLRLGILGSSRIHIHMSPRISRGRHCWLVPPWRISLQLLSSRVSELLLQLSLELLVQLLWRQLKRRRERGRLSLLGQQRLCPLLAAVGCWRGWTKWWWRLRRWLREWGPTLLSVGRRWWQMRLVSWRQCGRIHGRHQRRLLQRLLPMFRPGHRCRHHRLRRIPLRSSQTLRRHGSLNLLLKKNVQRRHLWHHWRLRASLQRSRRGGRRRLHLAGLLPGLWWAPWSSPWGRLQGCLCLQSCLQSCLLTWILLWRSPPRRLRRLHVLG